MGLVRYKSFPTRWHFSSILTLLYALGSYSDIAFSHWCVSEWFSKRKFLSVAASTLRELCRRRSLVSCWKLYAIGRLGFFWILDRIPVSPLVGFVQAFPAKTEKKTLAYDIQKLKRIHLYTKSFIWLKKWFYCLFVDTMAYITSHCSTKWRPIVTKLIY